jgi:hypothetical protein
VIRRSSISVATVLAAITLSLCAAVQASAAVSWQIHSLSNTTVAPGEQLVENVVLLNKGDTPSDGSKVTLRATLPTGLTGVSLATKGVELSCPAVAGETTIECTGTPVLVNGQTKTLALTVAADPSAEGVLTTTYDLEGGGAALAAHYADPVTVTGAVPEFGFDAFDFAITDPAGEAFTQAARHPEAVNTWFDFNTRTNPSEVIGELDPVEEVKDVSTELPPGLLGNLNALEECTLTELENGGLSPKPSCPVDSQVGTAEPRLGLFEGRLSLYNLVPPPGVAARFGFNVLGTLVILDSRVRSGGDYGVTTSSINTPQAVTVSGVTLSFWGVPAAAGHDSERSCPGEYSPAGGGPACESKAEPVPFFRTPTACAAAPGPAITASINSWQDPADVKSRAIHLHEGPNYPFSPDDPAPGMHWGEPVGIEGCEQVPFEPTFSLAPTTNQADSPTGLTVDVGVPPDCWEPRPTAEEIEAAICQSDMAAAEVSLPEGLTVNASSATGQEACTAAQIGLTTAVGSTPAHFNEAPVSCPDASKLGTVEIATPLLREPLKGAVYLARQSQNPFGSLLAMYLVAEGSGLVIKQAGEILTDPAGKLTTRFDEIPQAPFSSLHVELFGGPRAPLRTPPACGTYSARATFAPWSGTGAVDRSDSFTLSSCPRSGFDPKLSAGTQNPLAGSYSPFNLRLSREDGTEELAGLRLGIPAGLLANLKGIPYCPDATLAAISGAPGTGAAQLAAPSCPAASQLGTATAGAGAGPTPFYTQAGRAYWAGPYKGAPVSLAVVVPAVAGPFDLGTVVVRNGFEVDPETAKITAVSDPFPTALHGIPLDLRDVRVNLNRPSYTFNPSSCEPKAFEARITSARGTVAARSERFQAAACDRLPFAPRLSLALKGATRRTANPALRAVLRMRKGANIARASVALPATEFLDQAHIQTICTRVQFAAERCPKRSVYGYAAAYSPILDYALRGPVYLRSSNHKLPDLVAALDGQIDVDVVGRIDTDKKGGIRTTFESVPDAPVSKFVLTMKGAKKGLLQNSVNLCRRAGKADVRFDAQNGKLADLAVPLAVDCGSKRKAKKGSGGR